MWKVLWPGQLHWHRWVSEWLVVTGVRGAFLHVRISHTSVLGCQGGRGLVSPGEAHKVSVDLSPEHEAGRWKVCVSSCSQMEVFWD